MTKKYFAATEAALDAILLHRIYDQDGIPASAPQRGVFVEEIKDNITAIATTYEPQQPYHVLICSDTLKRMLPESKGAYGDIYGRVTRALKAFKSPPIHLPRHWSEFHYQNLLAFFVLSKTSESYRWVIDTNGPEKSMRFSAVTSRKDESPLQNYALEAWPDYSSNFIQFIENIRGKAEPKSESEKLTQEVDLKTIGSRSIVHDRTLAEWSAQLTPEQRQAIDSPATKSLRIIGPAGSGKTLALCVKACILAQNENTIYEGKKILIATHSWAMAERITGIYETLNSDRTPNSVTIAPLLYLLQSHAGQFGLQGVQLIGDDSKEGRIASTTLIHEVLNELVVKQENFGDISDWFLKSIASGKESRSVGELTLNLYEEFTGVLSAEGVSADDSDSIRKYLESKREDWMPPFYTVGDRLLVLHIYRKFLAKLSDRGAITTDQFVSDSVRSLETFTWRMKRESEGYDYIFIDELQLFDTNERLAIQLLGRTRGTPLFTAEDPSQGVFAPLHRYKANSGVDADVYLESVHRFNEPIFKFISFIYDKFTLNTFPLRIGPNKPRHERIPTAHICHSDETAISLSIKLATAAVAELSGDQRLCLVTLGDVDDRLLEGLQGQSVTKIQLRSFDDVEQLSYTKRAVVVAPWQYIGGTQFSNVIVVTAGMNRSSTNFGKLRELTAIYLACSRATDHLDIVCSSEVPTIIEEAAAHDLIAMRRPS